MDEKIEQIQKLRDHEFQRTNNAFGKNMITIHYTLKEYQELKEALELARDVMMIKKLVNKF